MAELEKKKLKLEINQDEGTDNRQNILELIN